MTGWGVFDDGWRRLDMKVDGKGTITRAFSDGVLSFLLLSFFCSM